jgi:hypothetical protein
MRSKHNELDEEMQLQRNLHEPRRARIESNIHRVRAGESDRFRSERHVSLLAELSIHDDRMERHRRGVHETLDRTDADYGHWLSEFSRSLDSFRDSISSSEQLLKSATTIGRLASLQDRLTKQRDTFVSEMQASAEDFRVQFEDVIRYLRESNEQFRQALK